MRTIIILWHESLLYVFQLILYHLYSWEWHLGSRQSCPTGCWRGLVVVEYDILSCTTGFINPPLSIGPVPIYVGFVLAFKPRPLAIGQLLPHHLRRPAHFDACTIKASRNCRRISWAENSIDGRFSATPDTDRFARCEGHGGRRAEEDRGAKSGGWEDKPSLSHHFCGLAGTWNAGLLVKYIHLFQKNSWRMAWR